MYRCTHGRPQVFRLQLEIHDGWLINRICEFFCWVEQKKSIFSWLHRRESIHVINLNYVFWLCLYWFQSDDWLDLRQIRETD